MVSVARTGLAEVGEVEAAVGVEHQVVWPVQLVRAAAVVKYADFAGARIDSLNAAADVVRRHHGWPEQVFLQAPGEAAVVADVERAVRADRCTIRSPSGV